MENIEFGCVLKKNSEKDSTSIKPKSNSHKKINYILTQNLKISQTKNPIIRK